MVGFDGVVVAAECLVTIFAVYGQPVLLLACGDCTVLSDVLIVHCDSVNGLFTWFYLTSGTVKCL